jgi:hypothetical protein
MRRDIFEIRDTVSILGNSVAVVDDFQIMLAFFFPANDRNIGGLRVDAVFNEFGDRLQGIVLGKRDDRNGIPVIPDAQTTSVVFFLLLLAWGPLASSKICRHSKTLGSNRRSQHG